MKLFALNFIVNMLLIKEICILFNCQIKDLPKIFRSSANRVKIISNFKGLWLRTTYKNRSGVYHFFQLDDFSYQDCRHVKAYNNFLGVTVMQHYYVRHRILIKHHDLPCVVERGEKDNIKYYPIELLEIVNTP